MKTLAERISRVKTETGWTNAELARRAGTSRTAPTDWLSGKVRVLSADTAGQLSNNSKFAAMWLATGDGPVYRNTAPSQPFDANVTPAAVGERRIPLLNYVQAGVFCDPGQNFTFEGMEYLLTDLDLSERAFALQIKGDSMQPDFKEGDRIIVDCEVSPRPGDFVVAKNSDEEATFKKYRLLRIGEDGREVFELVPLNQDYPSMRSDQHHVQIIGTMVEHRKYYRRS